MGTDAAIDKKDLKIKVKCYEEICMEYVVSIQQNLWYYPPIFCNFADNDMKMSFSHCKLFFDRLDTCQL